MVFSVSIIEIFKHWLAIEMFKFLNGLSPPIVNKVFQVKQSATYSLRDKNELYNKNPETVTYGTESISFLASKIWSIVSQEIKNYKSLDSFKKSIKKWKPICLCWLCKTCWFYFFLFFFFFFNYVTCHVMIINSMFLLFVRLFVLLKMICYIFFPAKVRHKVRNILKLRITLSQNLCWVSWEVEINRFFVIVKSYCKVNFT